MAVLVTMDLGLPRRAQRHESPPVPKRVVASRQLFPGVVEETGYRYSLIVGGGNHLRFRGLFRLCFLACGISLHVQPLPALYVGFDDGVVFSVVIIWN